LTEAASRPPLARLYLIALLTQFVWALNNNLSKFALQAFPPFFLAGFRTLIAATLIVPIYLWRGRFDWDRRALPKLILLGLAGVGMNQFFFVVGISRTSVTHAAFILPLTPLIALILSSIIGQERFTRGKVIGMLVAFSGVAFLQLTKGPDRGATLLGDALLLVGVMSFASYIVFGKKATASFDGIAVTTIAYIASAIAMLPMTIAGFGSVDFAAVPFRSWFALGYMAVFSSIVGYLLYYYVLTHLAPSRASAFSYLQPLMSTSIAAVLLDEPVTVSLAVSGALVLLGVWIAERSR
jgi:drug/metabolite transporter (DMT)-like permease